MRIVIDNQSVAESDLRETLALVSEVNADAMHPLLVAFADEHLPFALGAWQPPANTLPEFHGAWLRLSAAREMLAGGRFPVWCLNGSPGAALDPALLNSLAYTVDCDAPDPGTDLAAIAGKAKVRTGARTHADADALFALGADWVAGWPLPPVTAQAKAGRTGSRMIVVRLLQLAQSDADISELEALVKQDAGLAFKLLRFINSAGNGLSIQVESLQHAVMILGYKRLTRWLALLLLASGEDVNQLPLMGIALRRGFFMERVGKRLIDNINSDELFITGSFSLLDRIFGQPFEELLQQVHLPEAVSDALQYHGDPYGALLQLAEAVEGDDAALIRECTNLLGLKAADVNRALLLAIRDADQIDLR